MNLKLCKLAVKALVLLAAHTALLSQPGSQVSGLSGFHSSGQTFLTWNEISGSDVTYRVYHSNSPITDVSQAIFLGEVDQNTSVNIRAGSGVYFVIQNGSSPLNASTGLMVYTAVSPGNFYYAVTTKNAGGENKTVVFGASSLNAPIAEAVGLPEPVLQGPEHYAHWVNWQNTPLLPAMGNKPGLAYNFMCRNVKPSLTQILNVGLYGGMNDYTDKVDQINGDEFKLSVDNPPPDLLGPQPVGANDLVNPPNTCWYGYGDNFVPQQTLTSGVVPNYTQLRILYIIKWVLRKWPQVDPNRVYLTGSSFGGFGSVQLGFAFPNIFAAIWATIPRFDMGGTEWDAENGKAISARYKNIWGTVQSNLPTTNIKASYPDYAAANEGYHIYDRLDHLYVASQNPQIDFPVMLLGVGKQDRQAGWNEKPRFVQTMNASSHQFFLYWENLGHKFSTTIFSNAYNRTQLLKYRLNQSYVAINNLSIDDNPGAGNDLMPGSAITGDSQGTINGYAEWDPATIVDTAMEYRIKVYLRGAEMDQFSDTQGVTSATATLTPRRLQQFPHPPGKQYAYENRRATDNVLIASGNVTADANGLIHVANFQISRSGNILILRPSNGGPSNQPPQAVASASPTSGVAPLTVNFTGSNSTDPDGSIVSFAWNFGDGTNSPLTNPQHTYNAAGNYTATLTVTDNGGLTNSASVGINVAAPATNLPPQAVVSASPASGNVPLAVNFTGSNSADPDGSIVSYAWNFGDGTSATIANPQHTYNAAGNYTATLTVTDNGGLTGTASVTISATAPGTNQRPKATITAPANASSFANKTTISYAGQGTDPEDGTIPGARFTWRETKPNGTTVTLKTGAATGSLKLSSVGQHFLWCIVKDSQGLADSTWITITVTDPLANQPPNAVISASPTSGSAPLTVNFTGSNSADPNGSVVAYAWNFGDGANSTLANPQHTYNAVGTYTVVLTVTDNGGAANSALATITATSTGSANQPPVAVASASPTNGNAPLAVNFTGSNSSDPDGSVVSYAWNFGDGASATQANPQHTYNSAGNYTATLIVTDNGGLTNTTSAAITVTAPAGNQPPVAIASASPTSGTAPLAVNFTGSNSNDPDGGIASYAWNFGDGTSSTTANSQHTYNAAGNYTATLTVTDNGALTKSASVTITVTTNGGNQPPVATIFLPVANASFAPNTTINYSGDATDPEDGVVPGANFTWQILQPDGTIKLVSTGKKSGTQKISKIGVNKFQCIVKDSQGLVDTAEVRFTVTLAKTDAANSGHGELPQDYALEQNQPNPFNPMTSISFYVREAGHVTLNVYNAVGQKIVTLMDKELAAGYYTRRLNANNWPSGIYFYELQVNDFRALKRMILAK